MTRVGRKYSAQLARGRAALLVAFLLRHRGLSVEQLLAHLMSQKAVERELIDATDL